MTRVNDVPGFAQQVAEAGALPFLALAVMRGPQVEELLRWTQGALGERPWGLLRLFAESGARRFVFEGRECGGHVGPRTSFALWDMMIDTLLASVAPADLPDCKMLFAGGIHDARSAAMVSAMAATLAGRGVQVGVLLDTAYLFRGGGDRGRDHAGLPARGAGLRRHRAPRERARTRDALRGHGVRGRLQAGAPAAAHRGPPR